MTIPEIKVPPSIVKRLMETLDNDRLNREFEALRAQILELKAPAFLISTKLDSERDKMIEQMESFKKEVFATAQSEEEVIKSVREHVLSVYNKLKTALTVVQDFKITDSRLSSQNVNVSYYNDQFSVYLYETISQQNLMTVKIKLKDGVFDIENFDFSREQLKTIKKAFDVNRKIFTDLLNAFNFEDFIKMQTIFSNTFNRDQDYRKNQELFEIWKKTYNKEEYLVNSPYQLRSDMLEFKDICELEHDLVIHVASKEEIDSIKFVEKEVVKKVRKSKEQ